MCFDLVYFNPTFRGILVLWHCLTLSYIPQMEDAPNYALNMVYTPFTPFVAFHVAPYALGLPLREVLHHFWVPRVVLRPSKGLMHALRPFEVVWVCFTPFRVSWECFTPFYGARLGLTPF